MLLEICSSQKHALQRRQKLCTYFEKFFYVLDGFQYLFGYQNEFFRVYSTHKTKRHHGYMKIALKVKSSSIFSAFSQFESDKLTSERRQAPFRCFHGKSGVSGPYLGSVKHLGRFGAFLKAPEIKGDFHKARLQNFRVLINFLEF